MDDLVHDTSVSDAPQTPTAEPDDSGALGAPEAVLARLREDLGRSGYQRVLDGDHVATYLQRGPKLLVCFETLENALAVYGDDAPLALDFAEDKNWSVLHMAARSDTWFRSPAVYGFIDDLIDDGFFEDFDQVAFYGAATGAYAACAFSVAAPGAHVLAISPQATLDAGRAGWDRRFPAARRLRFDDRYGYGPDMVEGAAHVTILYDPVSTMDHVHASLFQGPNILRLKCRHMGHQIEAALCDMGLVHQVVEAGANGTLRGTDFYPLLRRRRENTRYLRTLMQALANRNQQARMALVCKNVLDRGRGGPVFRRVLARATDTLAQQGALPDWLSGSTEPSGPQDTLGSRGDL